MTDPLGRIQPGDIAVFVTRGEDPTIGVTADDISEEEGETLIASAEAAMEALCD